MIQVVGKIKENVTREDELDLLANYKNVDIVGQGSNRQLKLIVPADNEEEIDLSFLKEFISQPSKIVTRRNARLDMLQGYLILFFALLPFRLIFPKETDFMETDDNRVRLYQGREARRKKQINLGQQVISVFVHFSGNVAIRLLQLRDWEFRSVKIWPDVYDRSYLPSEDKVAIETLKKKMPFLSLLSIEEMVQWIRRYLNALQGAQRVGERAKSQTFQKLLEDEGSSDCDPLPLTSAGG